MTATLLANELANLTSESKRRNNDLRNAAEKSLQELKSLPTTSEQQLASGEKRSMLELQIFRTLTDQRLKPKSHLHRTFPDSM